jgi:hypothetical protein
VSVRRRLETLEGRVKFRRRAPEGSRQARARIVEHLGRVAALRRGEVGPEEAAEVESVNAAFESRLAQIRGEDGR